MNIHTSPWGDIYTGSLQQGLDSLIASCQPGVVMLLADENTATFCVPAVRALLRNVHVTIIPAGEKHKSLDSCHLIWSALVEAGADRSAMVLNVGGGVVCDLGGFAASCYQRGIRFGHIPTSLLAMADAAIGGKTGVDFMGYKNYLGRIEAPAFIWIDPSFLQTLPEPEIRNGLAEMVKHAIIGSPALLSMLEQADLNEEMSWSALLEVNVAIKKQIIEADPLEKGLRKVLNFGHTIGHALESHFLLSGQPISHGEAVTLGMMAESRMALEKNMLPEEDFHRIISLIRRLLRPVEVPLPDAETLRHWLDGDKKNVGGMMMFSLPEKAGTCAWNIPADLTDITSAMNWLATHGIPSSDRLNDA